MPVTKSVLRYPGGKTQLTKFIRHTIEINHIEAPIYCEPFCGGAGVAMALLLDNTATSIIINDADPAIFSIWYAVLYDTEHLISKILSTEITMEEWKRQKAIYTALKDINTYNFELAYASLFLNRTNRSGIISGGPIGGSSQKSKYTMDCRFPKQNLIRKILAISKRKDDISLYNLDGIDFIRNTLNSYAFPSRLFIFFDPPYFKQGQALYKNGLTLNYHQHLAREIQQLDDKYWITTYDNEQTIRAYYSKSKGYTYKLRYSANQKRKESELIFHSPITCVESFDKVDLQPLV